MMNNTYPNTYGTTSQPNQQQTLWRNFFTSDEHIGRWFKREIFDANEIKAKDVAQRTGISETKLSKFLNQKSDLDNDLAWRLGSQFGLNPEDLIKTHAAYKFRIFLGEKQRDLNLFHGARQYSQPIQQQAVESDSQSESNTES